MTDLLLVAAEEGHHVVNELPMPTFMYGVLALIAFLVIMLITYGFRNSWHRNPEHSEVLPFQPFVHHGEPVEPVEFER